MPCQGSAGRWVREGERRKHSGRSTGCCMDGGESAREGSFSIGRELCVHLRLRLAVNCLLRLDSGRVI